MLASRLSSVRARRKNSSSFGLAPGQPPSQVVELFGDAELVVDGQRDTFDLGTVAERRVEDLDRYW